MADKPVATVKQLTGLENALKQVLDDNVSCFWLDNGLICIKPLKDPTAQISLAKSAVTEVIPQASLTAMMQLSNGVIVLNFDFAVSSAF
ncbi:MAG: hypothetical protein WCT16_01345 [Candidatus Buchananbacteria bacterium]